MGYLRRILAEEGLLKQSGAPGTLGEWIKVRVENWDSEYTEWVLPASDSYGGLIIGFIKRGTSRDGSQGFKWMIFHKTWKGFTLRKHMKLLRKDFRPSEKGGWFLSDDEDGGKKLKGAVEGKMREYGAKLKGDRSVDLSGPPPSAEAMVKALRGIRGIKFSTPSDNGQSARYSLDDTTNGQAHKQLKALLSRNGFSGFNRGKFMGSTETGVTAVHEDGGKIFATVTTRTYGGMPETSVKVDASYTHEESMARRANHSSPKKGKLRISSVDASALPPGIARQPAWE